MPFFEPHPLATVISIFCILSLFSSFLFLFAPFRLAASVLPFLSTLIPMPILPTVLLYLIFFRFSVPSSLILYRLSYPHRFSASYCPLIASHLPLSPHSSKHFYFLSPLFRQFLLSLIASLPLIPFIRYRYSPLLVFPPASSPRFTLPNPRDQFCFPTHGIFCQSLSSIPTAVSSLYYAPLFVSRFHSLLSFPLPRLAPLTAAC